MKRTWTKDAVALVALVAAALLGGWIFVRERYQLGATWTDGRTSFGTPVDERIRHAIWDRPRPLSGVNAETAESRPALAPDGRWLVFAVGERGLNAELWVAEIASDGPRAPRPLALLNTPADELAPAFSADALWFASDRPGSAGGLDLWRAPYADGEFGVPELLAGGLNTSAEETDPCPVALWNSDAGATEDGLWGLYFASNRARAGRSDYEIFHAAPDPAGGYAIEPFEPTTSPADEREPALSADGRTLYFASDRTGSRGGFDLLRCVREEGRWLPPEPLIGVNGAGSERGPLPSADGFELYFDVAEEDGASDLASARSLELFRVPPPPPSLQELLLLAALLLLALLALLAKRWRAIDVLYKCFLVSLLVHLLLLWYLRTVHPRSEPFEVQGPGDEPPAFRVRLAPDPDALASSTGAEAARERALGPVALAPERLRAALPLAEASEPARALPATAERPAEAAPLAGGPALREPKAVRPATSALADRDAPQQPLAAAAPELALAPREVEGPEAAATEGAPERASAGGELAEVAPGPLALAAHAPESPRAPAPLRSGPEARASSAGEGPRLETPSERFEPLAGAPQTIDLGDAQEPSALPAPSAPSATRRAGPEAEVAAGSARPSALDLDVPAPERGPDPAPSPALAVADRRADRAPAEETLLRAPAIAEDRALAAAPAPRFDPTAGLGAAGATRGAPVPDAAPLRARIGAAPAAGASGPAALALAPAEAPDGEDAALPASALAPPREQSSAGSEVALRQAPAPSSELAARDASEESAPFDALGALGELGAIGGVAASAPERSAPLALPRELAASRENTLAPARPAERAPLARPVPPADLADAPPLPARLAETPYQNRFGPQKLRALEEFGGSAETEEAVARGLRYLASIQQDGGAWGETRDFHAKYGDVRVGKTGLALLAFLGAGHTASSGTEHAASVERAIGFLLGAQDPASGHFGESCSYSHGIATYALAECFALTQEARLRQPLERAVAEILRHQSRERDPRFFGGWGYFFADGHVWDGDEWPRTSVSAWQVMALESARLGGLSVPDEAFDAAREFLLAAWDPRHGAFRYDHDPERLGSAYPILPASTPAALFALSLLGIDLASSELDPARRFVLQRAPRDYRYTGDDDFVTQARGNLYFWYYATLAMFRTGGSAWERWNAALKDVLLGAQRSDGSWEPLSSYSDYAGEDQQDKSYTTSLAVLSLEIYYRYFTPLLQVR